MALVRSGTRLCSPGLRRDANLPELPGRARMIGMRGRVFVVRVFEIIGSIDTFCSIPTPVLPDTTREMMPGKICSGCVSRGRSSRFEPGGGRPR